MLIVEDTGALVEAEPGRSRIDVVALKRYRKTHWPPSKTHASMVVVTGHLQSGTSVIAAALGAALDRDVAMDSTTDIVWPNGWSNPGTRSQRIYRSLERAASRPIIKEPNLIFQLDRVFENIAPTAGAVLVRRDPAEIVESIFARLNLDAGAEYLAKRQFSRIPLGWQHILCGTGVVDTAGMGTLEALASRIAVAQEVIRGFDGPVIDYHEFLHAPGSVVCAVLADLGLESELDENSRDRIVQTLGVRHQPSRSEATSNFSLSETQRSMVNDLTNGTMARSR